MTTKAAVHPAPARPVTVTLPLPDRKLHPNGRPTRYEKARLVKEARARAGWECVAARRAAGNPVFARPDVLATFYLRTAAQVDPDNAVAWAKAYVDGLTDSGLWLDDAGLTWLPVVCLKDAARPRVEITVTEGDEA